MSDLKIEHAVIVTLDKERRILKDGAILVDRGVVTSISKSDDLRQETADLTIDGRGKVVTPGFFNNHIHTSYAHAVRGIFPDDLHPTTYLNHVFKLQSEITAEEEYYTCLLAITEMVKNGITCFLEPGSIKDVDAGLESRDPATFHGERGSTESHLRAFQH